MYPLKQSTSVERSFFAHDGNGDAVTGKVNGDWTKTHRKQGATSFSALAVTVTEISSGWYRFTLAAGDVDTLGELDVVLTASGVKQVNLKYVVQARITDDLAHPGAAVASVTGAVGSVTGLTPATVHADLDDIQARLPAALVGGRIAANAEVVGDKTDYSLLAADKDVLVELVWDELLTGATHNINNSAGKRLRQVAGTVIVTDTAQDGTATSITLHAGASAVNELYAGELIAIVDGTGAGQARLIVSHNGSSKVAKVFRAWTTIPNATSEFIILAAASPLRVDDGEAQGGGASTITLAATASAIDETYTGMKVVLQAGTGAGQARIIASYVGGTRVATVQEAWITAPDATTIYALMPVGRAYVTRMAGNVLTADALAADAATEIADALLARDNNGLTVGQSLASGAMNITIVAGVMTVKYGNGGTAFTRTLTREQLDAISAMVP